MNSIFSPECNGVKKSVYIHTKKTDVVAILAGAKDSEMKEMFSLHKVKQFMDSSQTQEASNESKALFIYLFI